MEVGACDLSLGLLSICDITDVSMWGSRRWVQGTEWGCEWGKVCPQPWAVWPAALGCHPAQGCMTRSPGLSPSPGLWPLALGYITQPWAVWPAALGYVTQPRAVTPSPGLHHPALGCMTRSPGLCHPAQAVWPPAQGYVTPSRGPWDSKPMGPIHRHCHKIWLKITS